MRHLIVLMGMVSSGLLGSASTLFPKGLTLPLIPQVSPKALSLGLLLISVAFLFAAHLTGELAARKIAALRLKAEQDAARIRALEDYKLRHAAHVRRGPRGRFGNNGLNALIAAPAIGGGAFFERISNLQFAAIGVIMLIVFAYVFFRLLREPRVPEELRGQLREVQADIASA